jgi:hypothetical protein
MRRLLLIVTALFVCGWPGSQHGGSGVTVSGGGSLTLEGFSTGASTGVNALNITCNYPATVNSGDLLTIFLAVDANPTGAAMGCADSFVEIAEDTQGQMSVGVYELTASGSEGGGTVACSWTASTQMASCIMSRISGWTSSQVSTVATGNSTAPDSSSITFGAAGLAFVFAGADGNDNTWTFPTGGYTEHADDLGATDGSAVQMSVGSLSVGSGALDPGAWALGTSEQWAAYTYGVE